MSEVEYVDRSSVTLVKSSAGDDDVAMAAWVSFNADSEERLEDRPKVKGLINFLLREKHMSPFEHSHFTFKIDCPLFVAREYQRHRTFAFNEVSGRYTEMTPRFYVPGDSRPLVQHGKAGKYTFGLGTKIQTKLVQRALRGYSRASYGAYQYLLNKGLAKEVARMVFPLTLMTQFYATVSARNLMHFLDLRTSPQALYEIRDVADQMEAHFKEQMPFTYAAWKENS